MPLPLIPIIVGGLFASALGYGAKKGYDAYQDSNEAEILHEEAKYEYELNERHLNERKEKAQQLFSELGNLKKSVVEQELAAYCTLIDKLNIKEQKELKEILKEFDIDKLKQARDNITNLQATLGGLTGGAMAGAMAGFGAYGAVGLLGAASTGTAISSLGGVAATNATLAWLGGGSLAAGGLGMAGGTFVLGGIVAAPVIAVAATIWGKVAESKKYNAQSYHKAVLAVCEHIKSEELLWVQIANKTDRAKVALTKMSSQLSYAVYEVEQVADKKGYKISSWNEEERKTLENMVYIADTTQAIINQPILNDDDKITKGIINQQKEVKKLMDEIQKKFA